MSHAFISIEELADRLGRDRREVEKLVNRGRIPGRKIGGVWQFHPTEIRHWVEQEMRDYSEPELAALEEAQRPAGTAEETPVLKRMSLETVQVPLLGRTKRSVLESLIEVAGRTWQIWEPATVLHAVLEREEILSTGFENGVAIPHPRNPLPDVLGQSVVAFGRTLSGIPFGAAAATDRRVLFGALPRLAGPPQRARPAGPYIANARLSRRAPRGRDQRRRLRRDRAGRPGTRPRVNDSPPVELGTVQLKSGADGPGRRWQSRPNRPADRRGPY